MREKNLSERILMSSAGIATTESFVPALYTSERRHAVNEQFVCVCTHARVCEGGGGVKFVEAIIKCFRTCREPDSQVAAHTNGH